MSRPIYMPPRSPEAEKLHIMHRRRPLPSFTAPSILARQQQAPLTSCSPNQSPVTSIYTTTITRALPFSTSTFQRFVTDSQIDKTTTITQTVVEAGQRTTTEELSVTATWCVPRSLSSARTATSSISPGTTTTLLPFSIYTSRTTDPTASPTSSITVTPTPPKQDKTPAIVAAAVIPVVVFILAMSLFCCWHSRQAKKTKNEIEMTGMKTQEEIEREQRFKDETAVMVEQYSTKYEEMKPSGVIGSATTIAISDAPSLVSTGVGAQDSISVVQGLNPVECVDRTLERVVTVTATPHRQSNVAQETPQTSWEGLMQAGMGNDPPGWGPEVRRQHDMSKPRPETYRQRFSAVPPPPPPLAGPFSSTSWPPSLGYRNEQAENQPSRYRQRRPTGLPPPIAGASDFTPCPPIVRYRCEQEERLRDNTSRAGGYGAYEHPCYSAGTSSNAAYNSRQQKQKDRRTQMLGSELRPVPSRHSSRITLNPSAWEDVAPHIPQSPLPASPPYHGPSYLIDPPELPYAFYPQDHLLTSDSLPEAWQMAREQREGAFDRLVGAIPDTVESSSLPRYEKYDGVSDEVKAENERTYKTMIRGVRRSTQLRDKANEQFVVTGHARARRDEEKQRRVKAERAAERLQSQINEAKEQQRLETEQGLLERREREERREEKLRAEWAQEERATEIEHPVTQRRHADRVVRREILRRERNQRERRTRERQSRIRSIRGLGVTDTSMTDFDVDAVLRVVLNRPGRASRSEVGNWGRLGHQMMANRETM